MISISNLKKEEDLEILAKDYVEYYNNSVLAEKWTKRNSVRHV